MPHLASRREAEQYVATALIGNRSPIVACASALISASYFHDSALLAHEYLLTLSDEVTAVWQRKFTNATLLFLINRYVAIFYGLTLALADQLSGQTVRPICL